MKCYLIAKKLGHSFSKPIHNALASYSYDYKELEEYELESFFAQRSFDGLNVTIPYKTTVMPYLDEISPEAQKIGAVNTIFNKGGRLYGYNTDYYGFCYMISEAKVDIKDKNVVIAGNGGASKTAVCVCEDLGAKSVRVITRADNTAENIVKFLDAHIIVNATPVGMYPDTGVSAIDINQFKSCEAVLDLIYNPSKTKIILAAQKKGIKAVNGLGMLVAQAKKACEIFTGTIIDDSKIAQIRDNIERDTKNIVFVGMPGCGKSSVGKEIATILGREFYDCDEEISKTGRTPECIIETDGEEEFRRIETRTLSELCKKSGSVIATGGGAVTIEKNFDIIHQNATVVFINRPVERLATEGRPLSQGGMEKLLKMQEKRLPLYRNFSHIEVSSSETYQETAQKVIQKLSE